VIWYNTELQLLYIGDLFQVPKLKLTVKSVGLVLRSPRSTRYSIDIYRSSLECMISQGYPVDIY